MDRLEMYDAMSGALVPSHRGERREIERKMHFFCRRYCRFQNIAYLCTAIERDCESIEIKNGALVQLVRIHACHAWGHGFESRTHRILAKIAQLVEQRTENPCVPGSIPGGTTTSNYF